MATHRILFNSTTLAIVALALVSLFGGCAAPRTEADFQRRAALANAWGSYMAQRSAIAGQRAAELRRAPVTTRCSRFGDTVTCESY